MEDIARRRFQRLQKELRLEFQEGITLKAEPAHRVDIVVVPSRRGYVHPLRPADIKRSLDFFGPLASYGLRSVELQPALARHPQRMQIARLLVPGKVVLYEQLEPPWSVRGLTEVSIERLRRAGAWVEEGLGGARVDWTPDALRDFVLFDGLMHEIGHHLIQYHMGKRTTRVMRTADHERRATAFADACRRAWANAQSPT
jgi:hypothetical protein